MPPDYQIELDNEPLNRGAEVYIDIRAQRGISEDELRQELSKKGHLKELSLEEALRSMSKYNATFGIKTRREGKEIEKELGSIEGIKACSIYGYYTPQGTGGEG